MDYLRSAASAVLAKSTGPFPNYTIGPALPPHSSSSQTIWSLHSGTKRDDGSPVSILIFDCANSPNARSQLALAKNALRKLRTLRHPDVLKLLDSAETPTAVYIAVEPVRPLGPVLSDWIRNGGTEEGKKEWISWGLSRIANALKFINVDAASIHGNIRPESVFLSQGGEWRLGGFDLLTSKADYEGVLWSLGGLVPDASMYASPEVRQGGWGVLRDHEPHVLDCYSFALLAFSAYNGLVPSENTSMPPQGQVPAPLFAMLRRMLVPNPKTRMPVAQLVATANAAGGMWKENRLSKLSEGCENFMLASEMERTEILKSLHSSTASLPSDFLTHRVLPCLVNALSLSSQPAANANGMSMSNAVHPSAILPLVLQLGAPLSETEWQASVLPPILKAYTSPDRSVRITLLEQLPSYVEKIPSKKVADSVWPNLITGFADSSAAIREATLKSILPLAPKLTDRIRNNDLLRQLAKTQVDVEAGIRTNTTILLGRLAPSLNPNTRKSVLIPAFSRSLKDPFVHARVAGLMALMATSESYDKDDLARAVLPAICPNLVDKEKPVRDQAERALEMFWARIKEEVKSMPESALPPPDAECAAANGATSFSGGAPPAVPGGLASTAGGAASTLAGWAMSGAMNYFSESAKSELGGGGGGGGPSAAAGSMDNKRPPLLTGQSSASTTSSGRVTPTLQSPASQTPSRAASPLSQSQNASSSWGGATSNWTSSGDLINIDDDTADWSAFEAAPVKKPIVRRGVPGVGAARPKASASPASSSSSLLAKKASLGATSRREMSSTGSERLKMVGSAGADEAAWGEDDAAATAGAGVGAAAGSGTATPTSEASAAAAAAAFSTPVPAWTGTGGGANLSTKPKAPPPAPAPAPAAADDWSSFPDADEDGTAGAKKGSAGMSASSSSSGPLSKEEKRAQMERQREERRERMRKLKESKGKKLGDALS